MKLDNRAVQILRNFSSINQGLVFKKGKSISTISTGKTIMAIANLETQLPRDFAIYDLSEFLGALSLFNEPDLDFAERYVTISSGKSKATYIYGDPENIVTPPSIEKFKMPEAVHSFELPQDVLTKVLKALGTFQLPEIAIVAEDGEVRVQTMNSKNTTGNVYSETIGECDKTFKAIIRAENLKVLQDNYTVTVAQGLAQFSSKDVKYYIAVEAESEFA